jgi:hypothetical protein
VRPELELEEPSDDEGAGEEEAVLVLLPLLESGRLELEDDDEEELSSVWPRR